MNMRNRDWLAIAMLLGLGVIGAQAEIRNDWEFNDVVGTFIQDATNSGTQMATFTASNDFFLSTDGSGALVDSTFGNTFTTADIFDITSGTAYLRIDFDSWNFDTNTVSANENVSIGFRDNVAGSNIVLARVVRNTNDTVRLVALAWNPSTVFTTVDTFYRVIGVNPSP